MRKRSQRPQFGSNPSKSRGLAVLFAVLAATFLLCLPNTAHAQIKSPGSHVRYDAELEPHGIIVWDGPWGLDDGFGLGLRASIPLFHNGPIKKINNNMAIGFGLDFSFYDDPCNGWRYRYRGDLIYLGPGYDCSAWSIWLPAVLQWNFYVTDMITVFGEPGFAISHTRVSFDACTATNDAFCDNTDSDTDFHPFVIFAGAKFMFGRTVGLTVRLGYPYLSVGASFLF